MEEKKRFKTILIYNHFSNSVETDSLDAALSKMKSMVGKITIKFEDKELGKTRIIKDIIDYTQLCEEY